MKANNMRGLRRLVILFYLEQQKEEYLHLIDPAYFEEDMNYLQERGLIKKRKLASKGRRIIGKIPQKTKRRMRRVILSRQNR